MQSIKEWTGVAVAIALFGGFIVGTVDVQVVDIGRHHGVRSSYHRR